MYIFQLNYVFKHHVLCSINKLFHARVLINIYKNDALKFNYLNSLVAALSDLTSDRSEGAFFDFQICYKNVKIFEIDLTRTRI